MKTVFGRAGAWGWEDACRLCVEHPLHPTFFVEKLWSYFVAEPPSAATRDALIATYVGSGWQIRPVLERSSTSPEFYEGPPMVKPPIVHLAGMLRALGRYIDTDAWRWLCDPAGQVLFWPPNVSGWDDTRWLDTSRMRARWNIVHYALDEHLGRRLERHLPDHRDRRGSAGPGGRLLVARRRCAPSTAPSCSTSPSGRRN